MSNVLVTRLAIVFGEPEHSSDPIAFMAELGRLTKAYVESELNHAADSLIRTHKPTSRRPWPSPADICAACSDAREALAPRKDDTAKDWPWSPARQRKADAMIACRFGQQAADQGWIGALWDFCRTQERLPNEAEAYRCRVQAKEFDEAYASFRREPGDLGIAAAVQRGFEARYATRDRLSRMAHGEVIDG